MGQDTLRVPMRLFNLNRAALRELLQANSSAPQGSIVLLEGGKQEMRYCSDHEPIFRQVYTCMYMYGTHALIHVLSFVSTGVLLSLAFWRD